MKRVAAIRSLQTAHEPLELDGALSRFGQLMTRLHDPLTWQNDVERRMTEMRLGEW